MSKKMISSDVVLSDKFLDMPAEARALYVALVLSADTCGGIIGVSGEVRRCCSSVEALDALYENEFLVELDGVTFVNHHRVNNSKDVRNPGKSKTRMVLEQHGIVPRMGGSLVKDENWGRPYVENGELVVIGQAGTDCDSLNKTFSGPNINQSNLNQINPTQQQRQCNGATEGKLDRAICPECGSLVMPLTIYEPNRGYLRGLCDGCGCDVYVDTGTEEVSSDPPPVSIRGTRANL